MKALKFGIVPQGRGDGYFASRTITQTVHSFAESADDAKRRGQVGFADLLTQSAAKYLDQIAALEKQPQQQRQQQPQSTDHKKNE